MSRHAERPTSIITRQQDVPGAATCLEQRDHTGERCGQGNQQPGPPLKGNRVGDPAGKVFRCLNGHVGVDLLELCGDLIDRCRVDVDQDIAQAAAHLRVVLVVVRRR
jgi:hypothetical protein